MHKIAINTRVNTRQIKRMDMEYFSGKVEIFIRATIGMMNVRDLEKCTGLMALYIRVNGEEEFNMGLARCSFLMEVLRKGTLKIMSLKPQ